MSVPHSSIFDRNPKKTLLCLFCVFIIVVEAGLKLYVNLLDKVLHNPFNTRSGAEITNELTHHDRIPNSRIVTNPGPHDTFEPTINEINSIGIRGPEIGPKRLRRVLFVGDSFIEADEVSFDKTFSERLNRVFEKKIQFIAHGASSWSPTTEFSWIHHKGLFLEPDEIYLFLVWNDFFPAEVYSRGDESYREQAIWLEGIPVRYVSADICMSIDPPFICPLKKRVLNLLAKSEVVKLFYQGYSLFSRKAFPPMTERDLVLLFSLNANKWPNNLRHSVDQTIEVIELLNSYLKTKQIKFYVTLIPNGLAWPDELMALKTFSATWAKVVSNSGLPANEFTLSQEGLERYLSSQLIERKIQWFSLNEAFGTAKTNGAGLLYNEEDGHWNWRGHEVVFKLIESRY